MVIHVGWGGGTGARKSKDCPVKMDEFPGEWTPVLTVHVVHNDRRSNMGLGGSSKFSCGEYVCTYIVTSICPFRTLPPSISLFNSTFIVLIVCFVLVIDLYFLQFDISSFTYFSIFTQTFPRLGVICIDVSAVIILLNLIKTRS